MLKIDKEILKEVLFKEFLGMIESREGEYDKHENFSFEFDEKREHIVFSGISERTYGADCWENEQKTKTTTLGFIGERDFIEIVENLIITDMTEKTCQKYGLEFDEYVYYDQKQELDRLYFPENEEKINEDYYYNYDLMRNLYIPIDQICEFLINFPYSKPLKDIPENLEYINKENSSDIFKMLMKEHLEENLPINMTTMQRIKL